MCQAGGEPKKDYQVLLDHARSLFEYHAGQRLNTIQYFFVAYAIFVAAYVSTITADKQPIDPRIQLTLSGLALIVSLAFFALDLRNQQLVNVDETALKELQTIIGAQYNLQKFNIAKEWEKRECCIPHFSFVLPSLYFVIVAFSAVVTILNACKVFGAHHP
jgi:hypothetical protein